MSGSTTHLRFFRFAGMLFTAVIFTGLGFAPISSFAEKPQTARPGIAKEKPASGPAVKVADGYMVAYTVTIPGTDVSFEMVPVPGGEYLMGSPESEADRREDEGPQVQVSVDPMWVAKTEVTWEQYKQFMSLYDTFKEFESKGEHKVGADITDAVTAPTPLYDDSHTYEFGEEPEQPAVTMTQFAAQQFTKWLSHLTKQQYRLPTEAEWEYAARAGSKTATLGAIASMKWKTTLGSMTTQTMEPVTSALRNPTHLACTI